MHLFHFDLVNCDLLFTYAWLEACHCFLVPKSSINPEKQCEAFGVFMIIWNTLICTDWSVKSWKYTTFIFKCQEWFSKNRMMDSFFFFILFCIKKKPWKHKIRRGLNDDGNLCYTHPFKKRKGNFTVSMSTVKPLYFIAETCCARKVDTLTHGANVLMAWGVRGIDGSSPACSSVSQVSAHCANCFLLQDLTNRLSLICQRFQMYKSIFTKL